MTKTLPTDKHGNIYYGPRTTDEAMAALRLVWKDCPSTAGRTSAAESLIATLRTAGFVGVANAVKNRTL